MAETEKALVIRIAAAKSRLARLQSDLSKAESSRESAINRRRSLLMSDDATTRNVDGVDSAIAKADRSIGGLVDAVAATRDEIASIEQELAAARDQRRREAEARRANDAAAAIAAAHKTFVGAAAPMAKALAAAGTVEAAQAGAAVGGVAEYLGTIIPQIVSDLRSYAYGVEHGGEFMRRTDVAPAKPPREPKREMRAVFFTEFTRWRDGAELHTAAMYSTHELPIELAMKAINCGVGYDPADAKAEKLRSDFGNSVGVEADPNRCVDLSMVPDGFDARKKGVRIQLEEQQQRETAAA